MGKLVLKDNQGNDYIVDDVEQLKQHLLQYHNNKGKADQSLHEENGHYFKVTDEFFNKIMNYK